MLMYKSLIKRIMDILFSVIGLVVLSPIFLIIVISIKLDSKGSVIFKQRRIGKNKREFNILKFRTMRIDTPSDMPTHLLNNADSYITKVGKLLRKTSLDELPQIINILKGDMSIVGPRPALWNQKDLILERDKYGANSLLPGLTGLAQINGRDELTVIHKAKFDGDYVKQVSLVFDLKIILLTVIRVVKKEGVIEGQIKLDINE